MGAIGDYLATDHRQCGQLFETMVDAVARGAWDEARRAYDQFATALGAHIAKEETVVYPLVEPVIGADGPTHVMRDEHHEMRALLELIDHALAAGNAGHFHGIADSLRRLLRANGRKEEAVIYPLVDDLINDDAGRLLERLDAIKGGAAGS